MVRAVCEFNIEKITKMSKTFMRKAFITAILFSVLILALGVFTIYFAFKAVETNWISVVLGGIITLASFYPIFSTYKVQKRNHKDTISAMQLDKGDLHIDMTFKEKKLEVVTTQFDQVQNETILLRNITKIKVNKQGVAIYIGDDMYYIFNDEIVTGTKEELLRIFQRLNLPIKNTI